MKTIKYYIIFAISLFLSSCVTESLEMNDVDNTISLTAEYPVRTKVTDNSFEDGDRMGVFVLNSGNDKSLASNIGYTFIEKDNRWVGNSELYWPEDGAKVDVYGYYPYDSNHGVGTTYSFSVKSNQSDEKNYRLSDILWSSSLSNSKESGTINLEYHHLMAGVSVTLIKGNGFDESEWDNVSKQVFVLDSPSNCTVNLVAGSIGNVSGASSIVPIELNNSYRAVTIPKTYDAGTAILGIVIGGREYQFSRQDGTVLASGKMHSFIIVVDKKEDGNYTLSLYSESIDPWMDDEVFHEGIIRQYVSVSVPEPGTLSQTLVDRGIDYKKLTNLKVVGRLNEEDILFLGDMPSLSALNMKEVIIDSDDDANDNVMPEDAFNGSKLSRVILPERLSRIGDRAFMDSYLSGFVFLPEGLTEVGEEAFCKYSTHVGCISVSFPSSLKYIGTRAFMGSGFYAAIKGELNLPEGLEYIGDEAFCAGDLTGRLIIPSTVTYIGEAAFADCGIMSNKSFEGDLIIPEGVTNIYGYTFRYCGFTGNLILPEGLESIGDQAFCRDDFVGDLVLPSSLTRIGFSAFEANRFSSLVLPDNINYIGPWAFRYCKNIKGELSIPSSLETIASGAFEDCSNLSSLVLPKGLRFIGNRAFANDINILSIICDTPEPPAMGSEVFDKLLKKQVSVQVPKSGVQNYKNNLIWKDFSRITEYRAFVCRPSSSCALSDGEQSLVLNSDANWTLIHKPDWVMVSPSSGAAKSLISLKYNHCDIGEHRRDSLVFRIDGTDIETCCILNQYGYQYSEDEVVTLHSHTKGSGINVYLVGDGWDAKCIAEGDYLSLCNKYMQYLFGISPYDRLKEYFDVHSIIALSQESGVNTVTTSRDTKFMTFASQNVLIPDDDSIVDYISQQTGTKEGIWTTDNPFSKDLIVLIPNSTDYVGDTYFRTNEWDYFNGTTIVVCPPSSREYPNDTRGVVQHEIGGRGFGKLGEEGIAHNDWGPVNSVRKYHNYGWYQNLAASNNNPGAMNVPWTQFIYDGRYSDAVDIYEGGYGYSRAIWRSELSSCMGNMYIPYYNAISRYDITKRVMELSGEGFDPERDFFSVDTDDWGKTDY